MWRQELEEQQKNNSTDTPNTPYSQPPVTGTPISPPQPSPEAPIPVETPIAEPVPVVGVNQTFSSRMQVEEIMSILVRINYEDTTRSNFRVSKNFKILQTLIMELVPLEAWVSRDNIIYSINSCKMFG